MNILFIIPSLDTGGAQTFLIRLVPQIQKAGHNVFVFDTKPSERNESFYQYLLTKNIKIYSPIYRSFEAWLSSNKNRLPVRVLQKVCNKLKIENHITKFQLQNICDTHAIQIVNSHMYKADLFAVRMLGENKKLKIISSFHGCYSLIQTEIKNGKIVPPFANSFSLHLRQIFSRLNGFVYVTQHQLNFPAEVGIMNKQHEKIYYGYTPPSDADGPVITALPEGDEIIVGMVARGDKTKGWEELILAYRLVKERLKHINCKLVLVGGGAFMEELEGKYPDPDILFKGAVSNPMQLIENFDIAVLPTYFPAESLPNSVIEYLYAGKPVIATDVAEIPLMIKSSGGESGGIIIKRNADGKADVQELSNALELYFLNPDVRNAHAAVAKEAFQKFDMVVCVSRYLNFFNNVLAD